MRGPCSSARRRARRCCTGWVEQRRICAYLMRKENGDEPSGAIRRAQEGEPQKANQCVAERRAGRRSKDAGYQRQRSTPDRDGRRGQEGARSEGEGRDASRMEGRGQGKTGISTGRDGGTPES